MFEPTTQDNVVSVTRVGFLDLGLLKNLTTDIDECVTRFQHANPTKRLYFIFNDASLTGLSVRASWELSNQRTMNPAFGGLIHVGTPESSTLAQHLVSQTFSRQRLRSHPTMALAWEDIRDWQQEDNPGDAEPISNTQRLAAMQVEESYFETAAGPQKALRYSGLCHHGTREELSIQWIWLPPDTIVVETLGTMTADDFAYHEGFVQLLRSLSGRARFHFIFDYRRATFPTGEIWQQMNLFFHALGHVSLARVMVASWPFRARFGLLRLTQHKSKMSWRAAGSCEDALGLVRTPRDSSALMSKQELLEELSEVRTQLHDHMQLSSMVSQTLSNFEWFSSAGASPTAYPEDPLIAQTYRSLLDLKHQLHEAMTGADRRARDLAAERQRQAAFLEAVQETMVRFRPDGALLDIWPGNNPAILKFVPHPELKLPKTVQDLFLPTAATVMLDTANVRASARSQSENYQVTIDHATRYFEVRVTDVGNGECVGLHKDITRNVEGERSRAAAVKAEAANQAKSYILASVSHDLRTPLNAIVGIVEYLKNEGVGQEHVTMVDRAAKRIHGLVDQLLDVASLERGDLTLRLTSSDGHVWIQGIVDEHRIVAQETGIALILEIDPSFPQYFETDFSRLGQVVSNLLSNAIKFTPIGFVTVSVSGTKSTDSRCLASIVITDTGQGMPPSLMANAFEPFIRGPDAVKSGVPGMGLGLSIAREIIQAMEGNVTLDEAYTEGTRLSCSIPVTVAPSPAKPKHQLAQMDSFPGLRALVAEDDHMSRRVLKLLLQACGVHVTTAINGLEALEATKTDAFDIVFMDCQMPVMDGVDATREIRALPKPKSQLPVVGVTAHAFVEETQMCLNAGMNIVLSKPVSLDELRDAIRSQVPNLGQPCKN